MAKPKIRIKENFDGLGKLLKLTDVKKLQVKAGILSGSNSRKDGEITNAEIGAKHEFGSFSENIPRRSFLLDPFIEKEEELVKSFAGIFNKGLKENGEISDIFNKLGAKSIAIIQRAFATGGFGKWLPLSKRTIAEKNSSKILIDTAQLRQSISFEIVKRD